MAGMFSLMGYLAINEAVERTIERRRMEFALQEAIRAAVIEMNDTDETSSDDDRSSYQDTELVSPNDFPRSILVKIQLIEIAGKPIDGVAEVIIPRLGEVHPKSRHLMFVEALSCEYTLLDTVNGTKLDINSTGRPTYKEI